MMKRISWAETGLKNWQKNRYSQVQKGYMQNFLHRYSTLHQSNWICKFCPIWWCAQKWRSKFGGSSSYTMTSSPDLTSSPLHYILPFIVDLVSFFIIWRVKQVSGDRGNIWQILRKTSLCLWFISETPGKSSSYFSETFTTTSHKSTWKL